MAVSIGYMASQRPTTKPVAGRGDGGDVGMAFDRPLARRQLVMLARLQPPLAGEMRIALADIIEDAGEEYRRQAAEHDRRQDLREEIALRLVQDSGIAEGQRDSALADAAGHDRHDDEKERVIGAEAEQRPDQR